jgi:hypothetical protein
MAPHNQNGVEYEMVSMVDEDPDGAPQDYGATHDITTNEDMALDDAMVDCMGDLEEALQPKKKKKRKLKKRSKCCRADLIMVMPIELDSDRQNISEPCKADFVHVVSDCCAAGLSISFFHTLDEASLMVRVSANNKRLHIEAARIGIDMRHELDLALDVCVR